MKYVLQIVDEKARKIIQQVPPQQAPVSVAKGDWLVVDGAPMQVVRKVHRYHVDQKTSGEWYVTRAYVTREGTVLDDEVLPWPWDVAE